MRNRATARLLLGVEGLRRPRMLSEHLDAAPQPTDEVTLGERLLHLERGQLDLAVGEVTAYDGAGDDLQDPHVGVDQDQDAARRRDERVVQLRRERAGLT